jgi:hypothetical protein
MTQEEKQLLLKDLCGRLPYGVKFQGEDSNVYTLDAANYFVFQVEDVVFKPYLRPMSSMTEEERKNFIKCAGYEVEESENGRHYDYYLKDFCGTEDAPCANADAIDWLNAHHFDYRNLIKLGLALEAPEGMYKNE